MKVYIVQNHRDNIYGVYDSKEQAQARIKEIAENWLKPYQKQIGFGGRLEIQLYGQTEIWFEIHEYEMNEKA